MRGRVYSVAIMLSLTAMAMVGCGREDPAPPASAAPLTMEQPAVAGPTLLPASAVNARVAALVWVDMDTCSVEAIRATLASLWPAMMPTPGGFFQRLDDFAAFRTAFRDAGGEAIVVGLVGGLAEGDATRPFVLIRVAPSTTPAAFAAKIDAAMRVVATTQVSVYAADTGWLQVTGSQLADVPRDGDEATAASLLTPIHGDDAPLRVAVRLTDHSRRLLDDLGRSIAPPLLQPLLGLDTATFAITLGEHPRLVTRMQFVDADAAAAFNAVYQAVVRRSRAAFAPATDDALDLAIAQLRLHQEGNTLSLSLDDTFARSAPRLAPVLVPLILGAPEASRPEPVTSAAP